MVRLKEIGNEPTIIKGEKFQFLMVRLKAYITIFYFNY